MWAIYNIDNFPLVFVNFDKTIKCDKDFDLFLNEWINLYNNKKNFIFIFDTSNIINVNIKYCIKMALFIKRLKKFKYQYLQKSIILVKNKYIMNLLDFIFYIQKPVAPVFIINDEYNESFLKLHEKDVKYNKKIKYIKPGKSLITLL